MKSGTLSGGCVNLFRKLDLSRDEMLSTEELKIGKTIRDGDALVDIPKLGDAVLVNDRTGTISYDCRPKDNM